MVQHDMYPPKSIDGRSSLLPFPKARQMGSEILVILLLVLGGLMLRFDVKRGY